MPVARPGRGGGTAGDLVTVGHASPPPQRGQVGDDDAPPFGPQPTTTGERSDRLVDALTGAAGHLGELALVEFDGDHRCGTTAGEPYQGLGDSTRQVEKDM